MAEGIGETDMRNLNEHGREEESNREEEERENVEMSEMRRHVRRWASSRHENQAFEGDDEETPLLKPTTIGEKLNETFRANAREAYPRMGADVEVAQINNRLSMKLFEDGEEGWRNIFNKDGTISKKKIKKELKDALGPSRDEIIKVNEEQNSAAEARIGELEIQRQRTDISEEVRNTTNNEIEQLENGIVERTQENERIEENTPIRERIKNIFKKYGLTVFSILTSLGVIISTIVSKLSKTVAGVAGDIKDAFKKFGKKLAEILPAIAGAIASFIFKMAGEAVGFLAKNAWLLILFVVTLAIELLTKNKRREVGR